MDPPPAAGAGAGARDPSVPLLRLSALGRRVASLRSAIAAGDFSDLRLVSSEIADAAAEIVLNGAAILAAVHPLPLPPPQTLVPPAPASPPPVEEDYEVVELDASELLAEHAHVCSICGKGFRRDANLRMHMRAHGDQFKTLDSLSRPKTQASSRDLRFSCPFPGCNRSKNHRRFRPLKSVVCARNHYKRSHCPKLYACQKCGKKSFAVLADLKVHMKSCGDGPKWRCSCGTTFSRKDKLFGHLALFDGHMPAVGDEEVDGIEEVKRKVPTMECEEVDEVVGDSGNVVENFDIGFFDGWVEDFAGVSGAEW